MDDTPEKTIVAIGNFDGVHKGHAALLAHARKIADAEKQPLVVLTFEPHPRTFFKPNDKSFRITPEHLKERRLKALGVDRVDVLDFNSIMANLTAEQFIDMIVVDHLNASHVVVGADFHFGKNRAGNVATLRADKRFTVDGVALEVLGDDPVSSTRIRAAIASGDIAAANTMLGWVWEIEGEVVHGDKRGGPMGYPTANIPLGETLSPSHGIYAVMVLIDGIWRAGAANIGLRPMFEVPEPLLEVFIFDFTGNLYGKSLRVRPVRKIRDEARFEGLEALKTQIADDCAKARDILMSPDHDHFRR
jgi:riboflavin kinase/FMN adenylyltransferase